MDSLEAAVRRSVRIPLTSQILIDGDRILSILEKLRTSLPEEIRQARYLTQENHRILREAHEKAESIIATANEQAQQKLQESAIVSAAKEVAEEIHARAKIAAKDTREGVESYARDVLTGLEAELERLAAIVKNGRIKLDKAGQSPNEIFAEIAS